MRQFTAKTAIGLAFWCLMIVLISVGLGRLNQNPEFSSGAGRIYKHWSTHQEHKTALLNEPLSVIYRDPVYRLDSDGELHKIGQVSSASIQAGEVGSEIEILLYDNADQYWQKGHLELHQPATDLARVAEVMFTPNRRRRLAKLWDEAKLQHKQRIVSELSPIVRSALARLRPIIQEELRHSLKEHQGELQNLADKYKQTIVREKLIPLIKDEVMPIVRIEVEPLMELIGQKLWKRISLTSFAWRAMYDGVVGPNQSLVAAEWERFLENEIMPTLEYHTEDFVMAQGEILQRLSDNPRIRHVITECIQEIGEDPEVRELLAKIVQQTLTENTRVRNELERLLTSSQTRIALKNVGSEVEPFTSSLGKELFGSPEQVTKEFALVLRHMILRKDQRWLVWVADDTPTPEGQSIEVVRTENISIPPFLDPLSDTDGEDEQ